MDQEEYFVSRFLDIKTYPEMDAQIVDLLLLKGDAISCYAAKLISELINEPAKKIL